MNTALLIIDCQNSFCKGGSLEVKGADEIVPLINRLSNNEFTDYSLVIATQDYHPVNHCSFKSQGGLWPEHCVQGTGGAEFHKDLNMDRINYIVHKGTNPKIDSYSGFYDNNHQYATELSDLLDKHDIDQVDIVGLAFDYCVKFTALDAVQEGLDVRVFKDATRSVDPNNDREVEEELFRDGVEVI